MMLRGILALSALALVVWTTDARAGGCAGCGTVLASPQASEQAWAAPQGEYCGTPTVYCEESCGIGLPKLNLGGCLSGLGCKIKGIGSGIGCGLKDAGAGLHCKLQGMGCGLKNMGAGLKCKLDGLGAGLKCHKHTACAPTYAPTCVTASPQYASEQVPSGQFIAPAPQYPSGQ
jgi:hypothetical protein